MLLHFLLLWFLAKRGAKKNFKKFLKNRSALSSIFRCSPRHDRPTTGTATIGFSSSSAKSRQNTSGRREETHTREKRARERGEMTDGLVSS